MTCAATTAKGSPCRRPALRGRDRCHAHSAEKVGRPSVFTQEVRDRLIRAKRTGCPDWVAAQSAGISRTTFYELRKRARAEEAGPYRELLEAIERAEAEAYLRAMALLHREMDTPGNFRAALAYVDRVDAVASRRLERPSTTPVRARIRRSSALISRRSPRTSSPTSSASTSRPTKSGRRSDDARGPVAR